ncbi:MAG TPA: hypothetical protein VI874_00865 [Candidatus Norongarragalinales archaeon]|nr:hypothetical protein [Candidatus Norongarragalinales archaeon]
MQPRLSSNRIPKGFVQVAWAGSPAARVQFIRHKTKPVWGIQGHPEAGYIADDDHPMKEELQATGDKLLSRFLSLLK